VRIVGGTARGRRLAPPADGTRPTADRTREALFNTLATSMSLAGARVLDLFAGTGAVGLEALSREAAAAVFVENNRGALTVLRRNIATLALAGAQVVDRPVAAHLATTPPEPFDLVFADPPYALDDAKVLAVLSALEAPGWLAAEAFVVVERPARRELPAVPERRLTCITPVQERRYGDSVLWYGRRR
jgi:16S rRNA (guanine966-N2)-methyltransferase